MHSLGVADVQTYFSENSRLTSNLRLMISRWKAGLSQDQFLLMMKSVSTLFFETQDQLLSIHNGAERAARLHLLIEQANLSVSHIEVSCQKGCAACCHFEVEIIHDEAALLAEVVSAGHPLDFDRLVLQANRKPQDQAWQDGVVINNRCVFLNDSNMCSIYSARPAACRRHSVTSPASFCADQSKEAVSRNIPISEII